jgi:hypothetical protein
MTGILTITWTHPAPQVSDDDERAGVEAATAIIHAAAFSIERAWNEHTWQMAAKGKGSALWARAEFAAGDAMFPGGNCPDNYTLEIV